MGAHYFVLLACACPPFGILDAEKISLFQKIIAGDETGRLPSAGA
ncbi:hypothetical protein [Ignatzschineria indica]|nr:hypothetical protein [Ignatzschineria indica]